MKRLLLITIAVLGYFYSLGAQDTTEHKLKIYKTWIYLNSEPFKVKGVLYEIKDSFVLVSNTFEESDYNTGEFEVSEIKFSNIRLIKTREKNSILNKALVSSGLGIAIGGVIGFAAGDDGTSASATPDGSATPSFAPAISFSPI